MSGEKVYHRGMKRPPRTTPRPVTKKNIYYLQLCLCIFVATPICLKAQSSFLDFCPPAREAALGGNGVALPEGISSLAFNPAGLGNLSLFKVSARYENLFSGIEGDDLSTGNLSAVLPLESGDGIGFSLDHFGSNNLEQDRLQAAFGKSFEASSFLHSLRLGFDLSFMRQQFILLAPLAGVNPANVSASAFSMGAGALYDAFPWATLGLSAENLNQPNLGVVGIDEIPLLVRYGVAVRPSVGEDHLVLNLSQSWSGGDLETQAGAEWNFTHWGVSLRVGGDSNMGVAGFGWQNDGLTIDYAYQFSWNEAPSLDGVGLPGSHLLEVGFSWGTTTRDEKVFQDLLFKGQQASKDKKWKEAFWYFQQASLLQPDNPTVLQGRSESLRQYNLQRAETYYQEGLHDEGQGNFGEAKRDYEWAVSLAPGEGTYSIARDRMKKALTQGALGDARVRDLLEKSVKLFKKGERDSALKKIKEAQVLYPEDAFLQFVAKAFARKDVSPTDKESKKIQQLSAEAEIFRSKGRLDLARDTWQEILKSDPANGLAKENLSESNSSETTSNLTESQKAQVQTLLQRGLKAYADGDTEAALNDWQEVLQIDPVNVNALNNLTRVKMEEGEGKK